MQKLRSSGKQRPGVTARRRYRLAAAGLAMLLLLTLAGIYGACWLVVHPARHRVNTTPAARGLAYREVTFPSRSDGLPLKGWLIPAQGSDRTVIFAHGYRNNRLQDDVPALSLAKDLVEAGYNVLMFDFRNCGESPGTMTSFGLYEVRDLLGAVDFVRSSPEISRRVALLGFSMGAATSILAGAQEPAVDAVIADSPFADFRRHISDKAGPLGTLAVPAFQLCTGIDPGRISPLKALPALDPTPLLLVHGEADRVVPFPNSTTLNKAANSAVALLAVPGAGHLKGYTEAKSVYRSQVIDFLHKYAE